MAEQISNQVIYDLIRDFKVDVDRRFEYMEKNSELRFAQLEKRMDTIENTLSEHSRTLAEHGRSLAEHSRLLAEHSRSLAELSNNSRTLAEHSNALAELSNHNSRVKISFSRGFALFNAFIAAMISGTMIYSFNNK